MDAEYIAPYVEPEPVPEPIPEPKPEPIPEPIPEPEPIEEVPEPEPVIEEKVEEPVEEPAGETKDEDNGTVDIDINNLKTDIDSSTKVKEEDQAEDPAAEEEDKVVEPEPIQIELKTGDKVVLADDVNTDVFAQFTSFKSTQFFVRDFEDNEELLTALPEQEAEELSWWNKDSGAGMPNWTLILLASLILVFMILGFYIYMIWSRTKKDRSLQERAIMHELQLAKSEGVDIPSDLEKRLERFQHQEMEESSKSTKSGKSAKVAPMGSGSDFRSQRNVTRYQAQNSGLSMSEKKMVPNETKDGYQRKLTRNQKSNLDGPVSSPWEM